MNNNNNGDLQGVAVAAIAAASSTPFWTSFKITMGVAAAHLLSLGLFVVGVATVILTVSFFLN